MKYFRNLHLGLKLGLPVLAVAFVAMGGLTWYAVRASSAALDTAISGSMAARVAQFAAMTDLYNRELTAAAGRLGRLFAGIQRNRLALDAGQVVKVNGNDTPALFDGTSLLNNSTERVDRFTADSGAVATIFVRSGEDFVRVATSLKDAEGKRAVGTKLAREHPAYAGLVGGNAYTGRATLFGREYMTTYLPFRDEGGKVIGAWFIGLDFTAGLASLKQTFAREKVGEHGYFFVIDNRPGPGQGIAIVHPTLEGKNLLQEKDARTGEPYVRTMLDRKTGEMAYWTGKGADSDEQMALFAPYEAWNWTIVATVPWDEVAATSVTLRNWIGLASLLALGFLALAVRWLTQRLVSTPLANAVETTRKVAAGDLTVEVAAESKDEVGQLLGGLGAMVGQLRGTVTSIHRSSDQIATATVQIAAGNADLARRTEAQAASLEETAASMEELTTAVRQNAENAKEANQVAASASETAVHGGAVVREVVTTMNSISASSKRIADIIGVIDGIAFQTNILALNAAVEAARAGEQGRGFAVVASEVRSLAQRSAAAAKEIKDLITDSVDRVAAGSRLVDDAGDTIERVVVAVKRVTDIMSEITTASLEQSAGIGQVNEAVTQMDHTTQQNAALVEESAAAAAALEAQARRLAEEVAVFRIGEGDAIAGAVETHEPEHGIAEPVASVPAVRRIAGRSRALRAAA